MIPWLFRRFRRTNFTGCETWISICFLFENLLPRIGTTEGGRTCLAIIDNDAGNLPDSRSTWPRKGRKRLATGRRIRRRFSRPMVPRALTRRNENGNVCERTCPTSSRFGSVYTLRARAFTQRAGDDTLGFVCARVLRHARFTRRFIDGT